MNKSKSEKERWIHCYNSSQKILLVGEGDFSFSLCLARALRSHKNIVATSYHNEDLQILKHVASFYNLEELKSLGCLLLYEVDVYKMHTHPVLKDMKFDIIIYNFPHAGHFYMSETSLILIEMHRELVGAYFKSASKMLNEGGEVHLRHRDDSPYCKWNVVVLAAEAGLKLKEKAFFQMCDYPGYNNIRGGNVRTNEKFPVSCAYTFKFSLDLPLDVDDHPKNLEIDQDLNGKSTNNNEVYDHGLSKKNETDVSNMDDLNLPMIDEIDVLSIKNEVNEQKNQNADELDDNILEKDEVDDDHILKNENVQDHLSKKDEVSNYLDGISLLETNVYVREHNHEIMHDEDDVVPTKHKLDNDDDEVFKNEGEECVDLDIHVMEISDLVQEECPKNEVDVVHELEGLSLLDAMKVHDHHDESPKDVVDDDGY